MKELTAHQLSALARVNELLEEAGIDYWLFGGWAVDFYVGSVTREHDDLDLAVWVADLPRIAELLRDDGWRHARSPTKTEARATSAEPSGSSSRISSATARDTSSRPCAKDTRRGPRRRSRTTPASCAECARVLLVWTLSYVASRRLATIRKTRRRIALISDTWPGFGPRDTAGTLLEA
jgi:hypothetical protein